MIIDRYIYDKFYPGQEIPKGIKIGAAILEVYLAWRAYQAIKGHIATVKGAAAAKAAQDPRFQFPTATYELPGWSQTTVQTPNIAQLAGKFYYYYNPDGWNSSESGLWKTAQDTPPQYFKAVADYYRTQYNRDLLQDLEEQLSNVYPYYQYWEAYKSQIV